MLIKRTPSWALPESAVTPEDVFRNRRRLIQGMGAGAILAAAGPGLAGRALASQPELPGDLSDDPSKSLYPVPRNDAFTVDRPITEPRLAATYNNFYEFGSHKEIWQAAQDLQVRPWTVTFDGMVEEERQVDIDTLLKAMDLEERVYRHRCVEAWSMTVPWAGFPMKALVDYARPLSGAKYVRMETFQDKDMAPGQRQFWYPWPYVEGLTIEEARNELAFMATGLYGQPMPKQNGSPIRLVAPWKYGFKCIKSIVRFTFTDERPVSFWEEIQGSEYGFWANVNPEVPHPRWSQARERPLGQEEKIPTLLFNGYAEQVAGLYEGMEGERLFM